MSAPCCETAIYRTMGATFAAMVRADLTPAEFATVRRRNASPEYGPGVCASHDFRDANMIMADAFAEVMGGEIDCEREDHCEAWGRAWDYARAEFLTGVDPLWTVGAVVEYANGFLATVRHADGAWAVLDNHPDPRTPSDGRGLVLALADEDSPGDWITPGDEDAAFCTMSDALEALAVAQHDPASGGVNRWRLGEVEPMTGAAVVHVDGRRAVLREAGEGGFFVGYANPDAREPGRSWCYGDDADGATFATLAEAVAEIGRENARP